MRLSYSAIFVLFGVFILISLHCHTLMDPTIFVVQKLKNSYFNSKKTADVMRTMSAGYNQHKNVSGCSATSTEACGVTTTSDKLDISTAMQKYAKLSSKLFEDTRYKNNVHLILKIAMKYGAVTVPTDIIYGNAVSRKSVTQSLFEKIVGPDRLAFYKQNKTRLYYSRHCLIFDYKERALPMAKKLFSDNDTYFLNIVRQPVEKFKSLMQFRGHNQKVVHSQILALRARCSYLESARCGSFTDILPCKISDGVKCVNGKYTVFSKERALIYLDKFDLVMIMEQMSESIVLMADLLGFPVEELGTVKLKAVTNKFHNYTQFELEILDKYYQSDFFFYKMALQRYEQRKTKLGLNFISEKVRKLKDANSRIEKICGYQFVAEDASKNQAQSRFKMTIADVLSDPLKLVECLPLLEDLRNGIESFIVESLEDAHKKDIKSTGDALKSKTQYHYPYNLSEFFTSFTKRSSSKLLNQSLFV